MPPALARSCELPQPVAYFKRSCSRERHASLPGAFETATAMTICGCVFWAALEAAASCRR
eukprot:105839-Prymnesium_polylepis.1